MFDVTTNLPGDANTSGLRYDETPMRNVHGQVAERLGISIVRGDTKPGDPLPSEVRICEMMNVSRTVVREAIRTLVSKGLLESRPKSGTRVRPQENWNHLDPDVLRWRLELADTDTYLVKLYQLRQALDPMASAIAATNAEQSDRERIAAAFQQMTDAKDDAAFVIADIAFHKAIYLATRNEFFWPVAQMFDFTLRQSFTIAAGGSHRAKALSEHHDLLAAIEARDPQRARDATEILVGHSATNIAAIRGRNPLSN